MKSNSRVLAWAHSREGAGTIGLTVLLFVLSFGLYARTMAPGLLDGDEGEFQTNIYRLGVSHTGYPLFFLLGKLWTIIVPVGAIATRANLFSVFWGALAVGSIYLFVRFLTRNHWAASLCALLFTVSRVEWSQAIIPRPYTMNSLFVVLVTFFFFLWRIGKVDLTVPVFVFGLSLTNHRTMMWFAPAIAFLVLWHEREKVFQPRRLVSLVVAFVLPLLLYGYVFWRGESDVGVEFHWKDFNDEIMGGYVRASWRFGPLDWLVSRVTDLYIPMLIEQFTVFGFIAGLIGLAALALDRVPRGFPRELPPREALFFIILANLVSSAFCVIFWVIDIDKFFLQSFITFLFLIGIGIATLWEWLAAHPLHRVTQMVSIIFFLGVTGFLLRQNYAVNDFSGRTSAIVTWEENLSQPLEKNALIVGSWESLTPFEYSMYVDGRRRDLERWKVIIKNYQLGQVPYGSRQEDIERQVKAGRPVYLTVHPTETETLGTLANEFRMTRVGELWRVLNLPPTDCGVQSAECRLRPKGSPLAFTNREGHSIELLGYTIFPGNTLRAGDFGLLTLFWRAPQSLNARFTISLRLMDSQNRLMYQRDSEPASGLRPTIGWAPGENVQDDAVFFVPPDVLPGAYHLIIVVYNPANGEELTTPGGVLFPVCEVNVAQP